MQRYLILSLFDPSPDTLRLFLSCALEKVITARENTTKSIFIITTINANSSTFPVPIKNWALVKLLLTWTVSIISKSRGYC